MGNPEIHMIPPKSPPKPKRSRGTSSRPLVPPEDDLELIMRDDESQSAFQFDLCQQAELMSLEDIEHKTDKPIYDDDVDTTEDVYKLLEAVQSVHKAVQSNNSGEEEPPVPPYPDVRNLRLDEASKMAAVSQSAQFSSQHSTSYSSSVQPGHIFSDDELSEIFQIDFGQIFGNPEAGLKSNYKGIQSKRTTQAQSNSTAVSTFSPPLSTVPPPVEFQSSPKNFIVNESENIVKRRKDKKIQNNSNVEELNMMNKEVNKSVSNGSYKYSRNSLRELDAQIMDIQTQFESELESLVDMYKTLQKRKSQGLLTVDKSTEELSTLRSNNSTIRRFCVSPC